MELPKEIIIEIAEQMDMPTLISFMATSKKVKTLIKTFEHSIARSRASTFLLPPAGNVLSSSGPERYMFPKDTFKSVLELELRDKRINFLVDQTSAYLDITSPPNVGPLSVAQQRRLAPFIKRALWQCDAIADIAASAPCEAIPVEYYDLMHLGLWRHPTSDLTEHFRNMDPFTSRRARPVQIQYIQSLPREDVSMLLFLITLTSSGYVRAKLKSSDPALYERITVFEECVLRHGSWFLWSHLHGGDAMKEMVAHMHMAGMAELTYWETGYEDALPGLKMTLIERFVQLTELPDHEWMKTVYEKVYETVKKMIGDL
ncbi:hypothetical protein F4778DRAFT_439002 [Xylariomycetidae sp. FL2044]|nr:hypothetical protein F4778DRAFT_439002 [Xylariomycetidae sp. FL2044]